VSILNSHNKHILYFYVVSQLIVLSIAIFFANERLFIDSGYYFFKTINSQQFHIEHGRWVLGLQECWVLLAVKLKCSLTTLMYLNSITPIIWINLFALFIWHKTNMPNLILAFPFLQCLGIMHCVINPLVE
jgi:hypothetical protein